MIEPLAIYQPFGYKKSYLLFYTNIMKQNVRAI